MKMMVVIFGLALLVPLLLLVALALGPAMLVALFVIACALPVLLLAAGRRDTHAPDR